ncbi:MAG: M48 family peptidase [Deltaproteobacteria bacterium]|nr:MAG: M48 family peptidase [Deltaproteobacteria bacterium]
MESAVQPQFNPMIQLNLLLFSFLGVFLLRSAAQVLLDRLNIAHLRKHGGRIPEVFQGTIDQEKLQKISAYTVDSARFGILTTLSNQGLLLVLLLSGILPWIQGLANQWDLGVVTGGLFFFALLSLPGFFLDIPFSLYGNFVIEARHGFNTKTLSVWIADFLKSLFLSALLGAPLLALLLFLIQRGGPLWWLWAWALVGLFELLILWLYPVLLAPLFNKFEPLANPDLVRKIADLLGKAGLKAKGVFQMDASRRSRHTNAYFTGLGKSKRIVLFDTLLASHSEEEILAVLAHEAGHWKKRHIAKQVLILEALSLLGFYGVAKILDVPLIYQTFGFSQTVAYVGLFLVTTLFSPLLYFAEPLGAAFSRRFEREADDYGLLLTQNPEPMIKALKRLASDNLSNLTPHPLYAWFYYSHPPLLERIRRLQESLPGPGSSEKLSTPAEALPAAETRKRADGISRPGGTPPNPNN